MAGLLGDDFKERIREATNLVDLVSETVALTPTRNGTDYVGLCPFHEDRNPSFHVYPDRQSYRCWPCQKGGDCFSWVMEIEGVEFPEAIRMLANRAGIELPEQEKRAAGPRITREDRATAIEVLEWATKLMHQTLLASPEDSLIKRYIQERNLTEETIRQFQLGYHPENYNWFSDRAKGLFSERQLKNVALITDRSRGPGVRDNYVGRLVFPIINERGQTVSFGGRLLPGSNIESPAKYWNGPETPVFVKRKTLYGFDQARSSVREQRTAIVTEGYMDCIACHQAGFSSAVATLGTALAVDHVKFLRRFCDQVVVLYDGDAPGQQAAERSIELFLAEEMDIRIGVLPEGMDPADYLEEKGNDAFDALIKSAPEAWEFKLQTVISRVDRGTVAGRQQILDNLIEFLAGATGIQGTVREDLVIKAVCQKTQLDETIIRRQLHDARRQNTTRRFIRKDRPGPPASIAEPSSAADRAEREVLEIILTLPEYTNYIRHQIGGDDFQMPQHRRLLELCFDMLAEDGLLPESDRVIAAANSDSMLVGLINDLLDSADEKGLSNLMNEQPLDQEESIETEVPVHLERVLDPIRQRRAKNQNLLSKQQLAQTDQSTSKLPSDTVDALRRIFLNRKNEMGDDPPALK